MSIHIPVWLMWAGGIISGLAVVLLACVGFVSLKFFQGPWYFE